MNDIKEIKKEFEEKFNLHHPATDTRNRVWVWIEKTITQREREAVEGFVDYIRFCHHGVHSIDAIDMFAKLYYPKLKEGEKSRYATQDI